MTITSIGEIALARVEENSGPSFKPGTLYGDVTAEHLEKHRAWLMPTAYDESLDRFIMSLHSWVLRTRHHTILIDTCVGNHKPRRSRQWNMLDRPWLDRLARAGVRPEEVDYVLCTHLHTDHVGWNTRLENGRWLPTFPNARYLMGKADYDRSLRERDERPGEPPMDGAFEDSVLPVVEAGQAVMLDGAFEIEDGLLIEPAPGHTPGHVTMEVSSGDASALFVGDIMHHPIQVYEPHWNSNFCASPEEAAATRRRVLERVADRATLLVPAHFPAPHKGRVRSAAEGFAFDFVD